MINLYLSVRFILSVTTETDNLGFHLQITKKTNSDRFQFFADQSGVNYDVL
jgi:hypothetical protein